MKVYFRIFTLCLVFLGFYHFSSYYGDRFDQLRHPANTPFESDLTGKDAADFNEAAKVALIQGTEVVNHNWGVSLQLGSFYKRTANGEVHSSCDIFPEVTVTLAAEGMGTNGEPTRIVAQSSCDEGNAQHVSHRLDVPLTFIHTEKPMDQELDLRSNYGVSLKIENVADEWPRDWVLSEVKLLNRETKEFLVIDIKEIRNLNGRPIEIQY